MTSIELLETSSEITLKNIHDVEKKISVLSDKQLKWRPNEQTWSINEIFSHLNEYVKYYHQVFATKISTTKFTEPKSQYISSPLGKSAWKSMQLGVAKNIKRKFNAPRNYNPSVNKSLLNDDAVPFFIQSQKELMDIIDKAKFVNIQRVKVPISISKFIRLRLGDAFLFVIYHNERHVYQALNLLQHRAFPKD